MINLLPPEIKEALLLQKQEKLTIVLGITIVAPLVCLTLILCSITLYLWAEANSQKIILEQTQKEYQTSDFMDLKTTIQHYNKNLVFLESFYKKEIYATEVLKTITDIGRPQHLYLTNLSLTREENKNIKVSLTGFAKSRDDVLVFQKNIEAVGEIKNPVFSPESWVQAQNTTFYVTFEITNSTSTN